MAQGSFWSSPYRDRRPQCRFRAPEKSRSHRGQCGTRNLLQTGGSAVLSCPRRRRGASKDRKGRGPARERDAVTRELSQHAHEKIPAREPDPARRQLPDAADSRDRSAAGTTERARTDSFGKIAERDFRSDRKTRTDNSVS